MQKLLKEHPVTIAVYVLYGLQWCRVIELHFEFKKPYCGHNRIGHGEFMTYLTLGEILLAGGFCMVMLLNALFRKGNPAFYLLMIAMIILPFALLNL